MELDTKAIIRERIAELEKDRKRLEEKISKNQASHQKMIEYHAKIEKINFAIGELYIVIGSI